ncbi:hypothetical protein EDC01DRAFT_208317 [Geopyxis carbonaria]|nr:hypothetical protein EDC01DRAFT_208317 [Geopyxis carbonaria]
MRSPSSALLALALSYYALSVSALAIPTPQFDQPALAPRFIPITPASNSQNLEGVTGASPALPATGPSISPPGTGPSQNADGAVTGPSNDGQMHDALENISHGQDPNVEGAPSTGPSPALPGTGPAGGSPSLPGTGPSQNADGAVTGPAGGSPALPATGPSGGSPSLPGTGPSQNADDGAVTGPSGGSPALPATGPGASPSLPGTGPSQNADDGAVTGPSSNDGQMIDALENISNSGTPNGDVPTTGAPSVPSGDGAVPATPATWPMAMVMQNLNAEQPARRLMAREAKEERRDVVKTARA